MKDKNIKKTKEEEPINEEVASRIRPFGRRVNAQKYKEEPEPHIDLKGVFDLPGDPLVLPREGHSISRSMIDQDALKVMSRLNRFGHFAFLVGGGVRDLLLGKKPKDFDIGTSAKPNDIRGIFRNSRIIGKRFKINHIFFQNNKIFEVTTFRSGQEATEEENVEILAKDNQFGDPETDALRRDITINGIFYDLRTFSLIDYVGGIEDLKKGVVRCIGEPQIRFREDPVRMLRAVRHAARAGFVIEKDTANGIYELAHLLSEVSEARLLDEFCKDLAGGSFGLTFRYWKEMGLLKPIFPELVDALAKATKGELKEFSKRLISIDQRVEDSGELSIPLALGLLCIGTFFKSEATCFDNVDGIIKSLHAGEDPKIFSNGWMTQTNKIFCSLGATKRVREALADMLKIRIALIGGVELNMKPNALFDPLIEEALELVELCDGQEVSERCRHFVENIVDSDRQAEGFIPKGKPKRRRRRRKSTAS